MRRSPIFVLTNPPMRTLLLSLCAAVGASFTLQAQTVTDIDGNTYPVINIGTQAWMAENLRSTRYQNGDTIPNVTSSLIWQDLETGARCYYDDDPIANAAEYGALYNWFAVVDDRNICPQGWHVPTDAEWNIMAVFLDATVDTTDNGSYTGTDIGDQLKEAGTAHWTAPNASATNSSGFRALPGGQRFGTAFHNVNTDGLWWTSTTGNTADHAWYRQLLYVSTGIKRVTYFKVNGMSCRCVSDLSTGMREVPDDDMQLFPDPAADRLNVTVPGSTVNRVRLFDPLGRCALDLSVVSGTMSLDVQALPPGYYSVRLSGPGVELRRSFIKE